MCGICGVWGGGGPTAVEAMARSMPHRGPDDLGTFSDEQVALGMTRLAILDLSDRGHQPMANDDGSVWIVYNGEMYNFGEQRARLEGLGHRFRSGTDTEVVLRLYEQYGDGAVSLLRGMFALAIYDRRDGPGRERLLLARDHFGIKPLLYARCGKNLLFASELKALLASDMVAPEVDLNALRLLLTFGSVTQPRAMIRGVSMLPPGHIMTVDGTGSKVERYWSPSTTRRAELRSLPYDEQRRELSRVVDDSVRHQLVSDVALGAFLSGGVDSSLLVALMTRHAAGRVKTFSVGFSDAGGELDESSDAGEIAQHLGTDHHHVVVTGDQVANLLGGFVRGLDQPSVDGLNSYLVSRAARTAVTVAISGTGGDELFAGYPWFITASLWDSVTRSKSAMNAMRRLVGGLTHNSMFDPLAATTMGSSLCRWREHAGFLARYARNTNVFGTTGAARLLAPDLRARAGAGSSARDDIRPADLLDGGTILQRVSALTLGGYTSNQLLRDIDATSMAHSLEVRVPLLDPEVADVALALPDSTKLHGPDVLARYPTGTYRQTGAKRSLIDVGRPMLPPDLDNQPKRGFVMPFDAWLKGPLRETMLDTLAPERVRQRGLLDPKAVEMVAANFLEGRGYWAQPWLLMIFELWCREMIDGRTSEPS